MKYKIFDSRNCLWYKIKDDSWGIEPSKIGKLERAVNIAKKINESLPNDDIRKGYIRVYSNKNMRVF